MHNNTPDSRCARLEQWFGIQSEQERLVNAKYLDSTLAFLGVLSSLSSSHLPFGQLYYFSKSITVEERRVHRTMTMLATLSKQQNNGLVLKANSTVLCAFLLAYVQDRRLIVHHYCRLLVDFIESIDQSLVPRPPFSRIHQLRRPCPHPGRAVSCRPVLYKVEIPLFDIGR